MSDINEITAFENSIVYIITLFPKWIICSLMMIKMQLQFLCKITHATEDKIEYTLMIMNNYYIYVSILD